eukprot:scaffold34667_cov302-Amphora_coffeaeformis.AAC.3
MTIHTWLAATAVYGTPTNRVVKVNNNRVVPLLQMLRSEFDKTPGWHCKLPTRKLENGTAPENSQEVLYHTIPYHTIPVPYQYLFHTPCITSIVSQNTSTTPLDSSPLLIRKCLSGTS